MRKRAGTHTHKSRTTRRAHGSISADSGTKAKKALISRRDPDYPRLRCVACRRTIEDWRDGWVVWGEGRTRRAMARFLVYCTPCQPAHARARDRLGLPGFVALLLGSPAGESMAPKALVGWLEARAVWERDDA